MNDILKASLQATQVAVEERLTQILTTRTQDYPKRLAQGVLYGALDGGKRLRPFLHLEAAKILGGDEKAALDIACALELVHCYSLVHDDLPGMDNADLRRSKPSVHKAFDEATAILAGTALYTLAFEVLAALTLASEKCLVLIQGLAQASGGLGMMGGQSLDMSLEQRDVATVSLEEITHMEALKTGALIEFALISAVQAFEGTSEDLTRFQVFGKSVGLAYQITDDLLDYKGDSAETGKPVHADAQAGKANFVSLLGASAAEQKAQTLIQEACASLSPYGSSATPLIQLAGHLMHRVG
jgi:farnesyl diphosphate synthase